MHSSKEPSTPERTHSCTNNTHDYATVMSTHKRIHAHFHENTQIHTRSHKHAKGQTYTPPGGERERERVGGGERERERRGERERRERREREEREGREREERERRHFTLTCNLTFPFWKDSIVATSISTQGQSQTDTNEKLLRYSSCKLQVNSQVTHLFAEPCRDTVTAQLSTGVAASGFMNGAYPVGILAILLG